LFGFRQAGIAGHEIRDEGFFVRGLQPLERPIEPAFTRRRMISGVG
jgi:hypothetical protein